jgi:hypothetical protein
MFAAWSFSGAWTLVLGAFSMGDGTPNFDHELATASPSEGGHEPDYDDVSGTPCCSSKHDSKLFRSTGTRG